VTALTRNKAVEPDTFERLARRYSEREICDIVWLVAGVHLYNISNIGLNLGSDGLCEMRSQTVTTASSPSPLSATRARSRREAP